MEMKIRVLYTRYLFSQRFIYLFIKYSNVNVRVLHAMIVLRSVMVGY